MSFLHFYGQRVLCFHQILEDITEPNNVKNLCFESMCFHPALWYKAPCPWGNLSVVPAKMINPHQRHSLFCMSVDSTAISSSTMTSLSPSSRFISVSSITLSSSSSSSSSSLETSFNVASSLL